MNGIEWTIQLRFVVALALGFLIGLERESSGQERDGKVFSGLRTFSLISLFGFGCAALHEAGVSFTLPVGLLAITAMGVMEYAAKQRVGRIGWTTEVAALVTFVVGALAYLTEVWVSMAIAIVTAILLSEKAELETQVEKLKKIELLAILRFLLVSLIIYPVLPDQAYTRFAINPTDTWKIVIMVSSVGFVGYFLARKFGSRTGLWLSGVLGGIVSSTVATVAMGRVAQQREDCTREALRASVLACSVMYLRILALLAVVNAALAEALAWQLLALAGIGVLFALTLRTDRPTHAGPAETPLQNPFEIRPAIAFAVLFVVISIVTRIVQESFGGMGFMALAALVGVTDIDPFLLSIAHDNASVTPIIVQGALVAMMSNTLVKGIYFAGLSRLGRKDALLRFGAWTLLHIPLLFL